MKLSNNIQPSFIKKNSFSPHLSFKGFSCVETKTHYNIGMMPYGYIGKIKTTIPSGKDVFLNLFKQKDYDGEIYFLKDDFDRVIGEMKIKIKKFLDYDKVMYNSDPSHVFVDELRNFSNPRTPYYRDGLQEYSHIGTKLLQVAQRRSDESLCNGNIELIAKGNNEVLAFYDKLGFKKPPFLMKFENQGKRYLPPESKDPLSKMYGGL